MADLFGDNYCPAPFLASTDYPPRGGEIGSRFCLNHTASYSCCLPCPMTDWVFNDKFKEREPVSSYVGIASLVCNALLLLTYLVLPEEKSHRHYLSIGLTVSVVLLSIAFIIPLGTKPEMCADDITPDNMHSDTSCAWTGALLQVGAMGTVVWILLRSIWTMLRIVFDFKRFDIYKWVSLAFGIGLPLLFMSVEMGVIGVSYKLGRVCLPSGPEAFVAWYVWMVVFGGLSAILLLFTIVYCLWKFALSALANVGASTQRSTISTRSEEPAPGQPPTKRAIRRSKRVEWARIKKVLYLQWRTILLAFIILNEAVFFGLVFTQTTGAAEAAAHGQTPADQIWSACLIVTGGNKEACLAQSNGLGLSGPRVVATWLLLSTLGLVIFFLQLRWSMFVGWAEVLRNPRQVLGVFGRRRPSLGSEDFTMQNAGEPKHMSLTKPLDSERPTTESARPTDVERPASSVANADKRASGMSTDVDEKDERDGDKAVV